MRVTILILAVAVLLGCKKDKDEDRNVISTAYDTIFPSSYFPAHPGSWWEYTDGHRIEVDTGYHSILYLTADSSAKEAFMPRLRPNWFSLTLTNNQTDFSYVDGLRLSFDHLSGGFEYICDTVLNTRTVGGSIPGGHDDISFGRGRVVSISDTLTFQGVLHHDVIKVKGSFLDWVTTSWFVQDVGLVKFEWRELQGADDNPIFWMPHDGVYNLESYTINR